MFERTEERIFSFNCGTSYRWVTITISKIYSGAGGLAKEIIGDAFTNGMYDIVNGENIDLNRATREVGEKLKVLLEKKGLA